MNEPDWEDFYDPEGYLLDVVGRTFRSTGKIEAADFYTILIWKAERAKNRHKSRLKMITCGSFKDAVNTLAAELYACTDRKARLMVLMDHWEFRLPTATANLTILYPEEFTVFDWRVCDELLLKDGLKFPYEPWSWRDFSEVLWDQYGRFKEDVIEQTPLSFRCEAKTDSSSVDQRAEASRMPAETDCQKNKGEVKMPLRGRFFEEFSRHGKSINPIGQEKTGSSICAYSRCSSA